MKKILIVDNGSWNINQLRSLLEEKKDCSVEIVDNSLVSDSTNNYDLVILSGSSNYSLIDNVEEYRREINWLKTTSKPVIGICLGYELIAYVFSCGLFRMEKKERGVLGIDVVEDDEIFSGVKNFNAFESHRWLVSSLSGQVKCLARSVDGIEVIKHKIKPIYGFQFHPEDFLSDGPAREIFGRTVGLLLGDRV